MLLGEGREQIDEFVDSMDYSKARIHSRMKYSSEKEEKEIFEMINLKAKEIFNPVGIRADLTGLMSLHLKMREYIVGSQVKGFGLAFLVIFIMFSLLVGSYKLGLIGMVPNVIPISLTFGIMGWTKIGTLMFLIHISITIGIWQQLYMMFLQQGFILMGI